jgi:uncharacterized membrane protein
MREAVDASRPQGTTHSAGSETPGRAILPLVTSAPISRNYYAAARLGGSFVVGIGVLAGSLAGGAALGVAGSLGWCALALAFLCSVWPVFLPMDGAATKAHARADDVSRPTADLLLVVASVASLIAVGYTLIVAGNRHGTSEALLIGLAVVSVSLGWMVVHTVYMLRYAGAYYGDPIGGVDFGEADPDYRDFAYLALTIGMTYQVSDTNLQTKAFRHMALRHALLSYLFGAVIVGVTINVVGSLLNG